MLVGVPGRGPSKSHSGNKVARYLTAIQLDSTTGLVTGAGALFNYFKVIVSGGRGRNGATVADTSVLFPAFPVAFVQVN